MKNRLHVIIGIIILVLFLGLAIWIISKISNSTNVKPAANPKTMLPRATSKPLATPAKTVIENLNGPVYKIQHPYPSGEEIEPLIIDFKDPRWGRIKHVYHPLVFEEIHSNNSKEYVEPKSSWTIIYDAYETPDHKGFVLYKQTGTYEAVAPFEELKIYDLKAGAIYDLEPKGFLIYCTKDFKYYITVLYDPYDEDSKTTLYYYDLAGKDPSKQIPPFKTETVTQDAFESLGLILINEH